jgi:hypothetical protein
MTPERGEKPEIQARRNVLSIRVPSAKNDFDNLKNILLPWVESQDNSKWLIHGLEISDANFINFTIDSEASIDFFVFDNLKEYLNSAGYSLFSILLIPASLIQKSPQT